MKAAVTTDEHGFEIVDMPDPTPDDDQLVIRVAACGVCGSDIKAQPFAPAGMVMGHELGGEIVAVGSRADGWREGTNVAVLPVVSCGSCQYCRAGVGVALPVGELHRHGACRWVRRMLPCPRATRSPFPPNYRRLLRARGAVRRRTSRGALRGSHRGRERAHRRCGRSRPHHTRVGSAGGAFASRWQTPTRSGARWRRAGCHGCARIGLGRRRREPMTPPSNAWDGRSCLRPASRRCGRRAAS